MFVDFLTDIDEGHFENDENDSGDQDNVDDVMYQLQAAKILGKEMAA